MYIHTYIHIKVNTASNTLVIFILTSLLQLGYPEEVYINKITVYDTVCGASSVSQVSVWNPQEQVYVPVVTRDANCNNAFVSYARVLNFEVK